MPLTPEDEIASYTPSPEEAPKPSNSGRYVYHQHPHPHALLTRQHSACLYEPSTSTFKQSSKFYFSDQTVSNDKKRNNSGSHLPSSLKRNELTLNLTKTEGRTLQPLPICVCCAIEEEESKNGSKETSTFFIKLNNENIIDEQMNKFDQINRPCVHLSYSCSDLDHLHFSSNRLHIPKFQPPKKKSFCFGEKTLLEDKRLVDDIKKQVNDGLEILSDHIESNMESINDEDMTLSIDDTDDDVFLSPLDTISLTTLSLSEGNQSTDNFESYCSTSLHYDICSENIKEETNSVLAEFGEDDFKDDESVKKTDNDRPCPSLSLSDDTDQSSETPHNSSCSFTDCFPV